MYTSSKMLNIKINRLLRKSLVKTKLTIKCSILKTIIYTEDN